MFVLGLFVGATISLILYGVLHAGATANDYSEIAMWREKYQKVLEQNEALQDKIENVKKKLKHAQIKLIGIGGYSDGEKEQKERVHK